MPTLSTHGEPSTSSRIFEPYDRFREEFNRKPFLFSHNLGSRSLFSLPRIQALAESFLKKKGPRSVQWRNSDTAVDAGWALKPPSEQIASVSEAITNLEKSGSWVLVRGIQDDPEYRAVIEQMLDELEVILGRPLRREITWKESHIFMVSPNGVTPYHIDHMATFVMQIHGNRSAHLWDHTDRSVLTEQEIENFYMGDHAAAKFDESKMQKATVYPLDAGKGVLHPTLAPHYYKNKDAYSVAMTLGMCLKAPDAVAHVYQINACLRQLGMKPAPPGEHPVRDHLKTGALEFLEKRKPASADEVIRSGVVRLKAPFRLVKKLQGKN